MKEVLIVLFAIFIGTLIIYAAIDNLRWAKKSTENL